MRSYGISYTVSLNLSLFDLENLKKYSNITPDLIKIKKNTEYI